MRKLNYFLIVLLFFPLATTAGKINNVLFDNAVSVVTIDHDGCRLEQAIKEPKKLILSLKNCTGTSGEITVANNNVQSVRWAPHDADVSWVIVSFTNKYQVEIESYPRQYRVCIASCLDENQKTKQSALFLNNPQNNFFSLNGIVFKIPVENMQIDELLDRSLGFVPEDIVRDGLPNFGSARDDWKGTPRRHEGYDIYIDNINVIAAAEGVVKTIGTGYLAGLYVKLDHGHNLYTVYVHLTSTPLKEGQKVREGEVIGRVDGPAGNAISPQLHFEIKVGRDSIDPLPLIESFYKDDSRITEKIIRYKNKLLETIRYRDIKLKEFLIEKQPPQKR